MIQVTCEHAGRLDACIAAQTELSRSRAVQLILDGAVRVDGRIAEKAKQVVRAGQTIGIELPPAEITSVLPEDIPLRVIYEDSDLLVIDKPQGMVVHPAPGHSEGTLVNALLYHVHDLSGIGGELRPGIVHRIDRMTSGLLVIAKNDSAHQKLSEQFSSHVAHREYIALVEGNLREDAGTIDAPIGRHPKDRKKMAVDRSGAGRNAITHWGVLHRFGTRTLVRCTLETGRTHQIRVHMAYIHHPVTGDAVYGSSGSSLGLEGQALHGFSLKFIHPASGEKCAFYSPLPAYFLNALKKLGYTGDGKEWINEQA